VLIDERRSRQDQQGSRIVPTEPTRTLPDPDGSGLLVVEAVGQATRQRAMSTTPTRTPPTQKAPEEAPVASRLSVLDRFLPVWIAVAMALGIGLGRLAPGLNATLDHVQVAGTSLPIAIGLLVMMYPVLAKVRYGEIDRVAADRRLLVPSLVLNWVIGPAVMFALAWLFLPDLPAYRTGLILVGLARCIAMVLIWNDLACGDDTAAAVLVAVNSLFQIVAYAGLGYFYLEVLPRWLGLSTTTVHVSMWSIARSVLVFLGVPLALGYVTRTLGERRRGRDWYEQRFLPRIGPLALYGLLFTIVLLFAFQGDAITHHPLDVARIALPLLCYFAVMWTGSFALGRGLRLPYPRTATLAFTAAGNNFELAIAVAIGTFGVTSGQALAGVVGPLIEVPALVALVYVSLWARRHLYPDQGGQPVTEPDQPLAEPVDPTERVPVVLFACVHNSGRSVAAKVLTEHYAAGRVTVRSAGSEPGTSVNPEVAAVLAERGLSTDAEVPTLLTSDVAKEADIVVTMGCGETCPVFPGKRYLDWSVDDPAGQDRPAVERIVDHIDRRVRGLLAELGIGIPSEA
jgi:arsenate reductase